MSENFAQLLEEFLATEARLGSVVKGTVVAIQKAMLSLIQVLNLNHQFRLKNLQMRKANLKFKLATK